MIHPVRAASLATAGMNCAWIRAACCRPGGAPSWLRIAAGWGHLSSAEGLKGGSALARPGTTQPGVSATTFNRLSQPLADQLATPLIWGLSRKWQAWSVVPPAVDRMDTILPSHQWPRVELPTIAKESPPPPPVQVISWRDLGGLLDMWV